MDKQVLIYLSALILITPLCLDSTKEGPSLVEQRFLDSIKEHNQSREDLLAAIKSEDYSLILKALSKYNYTTRKLSAGITDLCSDNKMREKYADTCSQSALLNRCNTRDVEGTALIMRLIHDTRMTKEDCNKLLSITDEQEECRNLAQKYVPTRQDKAAIEKACVNLSAKE